MNDNSQKHLAPDQRGLRTIGWCLGFAAIVSAAIATALVTTDVGLLELNSPTVVASN